MKTLIIEFPSHVQLHEISADGNVEVVTVKKNELPLPLETKPATQQPAQTI